jgi:hypothetical protein
LGHCHLVFAAYHPGNGEAPLHGRWGWQTSEDTKCNFLIIELPGVY